MAPSFLGWGGGLDIAPLSCYHTAMSTEKKETHQKMSIYFLLDLLEHVRMSAQRQKRLFNKEVLWLVEQSLERQEKDKHTW
jgi:hypothetical protein